MPLPTRLDDGVVLFIQNELWHSEIGRFTSQRQKTVFRTSRQVAHNGTGAIVTTNGKIKIRPDPSTLGPGHAE